MLKRIRLYWHIAGIKGLYFGLLGKLFRRQKLLEIHHESLKHPVWLRVPSPDVLLYEQIYLRNEYDFTTELKPKTIVDAGANIGLVAVYFSNRFPESRIYAIEPEQENYALLQKNTAQYANIKTIRAALWNKDEAINLVDPGLGSCGFMTESMDEAPCVPNPHEVTGFTVPTLMAELGIHIIDIFKVDIEGAEREVFADTEAWLGKVNILIAELHERKRPGSNRSFYSGTPGFDLEWMRGENVYLSRKKFRS